MDALVLLRDQAAGARDVLMASECDPISVQFHAPSGNPKYKNRRAEGWFEMAERINTAVSEFAPGPAADDRALLVVRVEV